MENQIKQGSSFEETFSFTQDEVVLFARLTGDDNPIHLDPNYAAGTVFKRPIMHGFLGGSIFSKILGTQLPGKGTIYLKQSLEFRKPMYAGESYKALVSIEEIIPEKGRATLKTQIANASGSTVMAGEALVYHPMFENKPK